MQFIILFITIIVLVLLIVWARLNAFLAFLVVCVFCGIAYGLNIDVIVDAIQKGIGDTVGVLLAILGLGAILGKLVADSGAAQKIAMGLVNAFGKKNIMWAVVITAL